MINRTTWKPDTCACSITYEWDSAVPEALRAHTVVETNPCDIHVPVGDMHTVYAAVLAENQGKNKAYATAVETMDTITPENFSFSFDKGRNLIVDIKGLDQSQIDLIQTALAQKNPDVIQNVQISTN